jgi:transcriptional regulator with XRE-family HTH domain
MQSGAEQLRDWMRRRGFSQRQAAEYFGWDETFISKLTTETAHQRKPGLANAIKIERETGIPVEAWVSTEVDESNEPESSNRRKPVVRQGGKRRVA